MTAIERFMSKVTPEPNTGCWLWLGQLKDNGYGVFREGGRDTPQITAHSFAFKIKHGRYPRSGFESCHVCDVRWCANPDHVFEGTRSQNMLDASRKGRISNRANAKLTRDDCEVIRLRLAQGESGVLLASIFNVSKSNISKVKRGWNPKFGPRRT